MTTPRVRELEEDLRLAVDERDFLEQSLRRVQSELQRLYMRGPGRYAHLALASTLERLDQDLTAIS